MAAARDVEIGDGVVFGGAARCVEALLRCWARLAAIVRSSGPIHASFALFTVGRSPLVLLLKSSETRSIERALPSLVGCCHREHLSRQKMSPNSSTSSRLPLTARICAAP